jgi:hypothetical protein
MTGEMVMPENAELGEEYWKGRTTAWGSIMGDESILIRPNYPDIFRLSDKLKEMGIQNQVFPFDVYQGPYIAFGDVYPSFRPLRIWYSEKQPLVKWLIVSEVKNVDAYDDEEALEVISTLLPLLCIQQ